MPFGASKNDKANVVSPRKGEKVMDERKTDSASSSAENPLVQDTHSRRNQTMSGPEFRQDRNSRMEKRSPGGGRRGGARNIVVSLQREGSARMRKPPEEEAARPMVVESMGPANASHVSGSQPNHPGCRKTRWTLSRVVVSGAMGRACLALGVFWTLVHEERLAHPLRGTLCVGRLDCGLPMVRAQVCVCSLCLFMCVRACMRAGLAGWLSEHHEQGSPLEIPG